MFSSHLLPMLGTSLYQDAFSPLRFQRNTWQIFLMVCIHTALLVMMPVQDEAVQRILLQFHPQNILFVYVMERRKVWFNDVTKMKPVHKNPDCDNQECMEKTTILTPPEEEVHGAYYAKSYLSNQSLV